MRLCREKVDITSVLKNILDNYPAGGAVLRELLQNSDDAGATSQVFVLDTRSYSEDELPHPAMGRCQGPALLAINDSIFKEKDWKALTSIHDSSKSADETTTGKYGLGFRSCYHVTDNPQVLSTTSLLILDPHEDFGDYAGGLKLESTDGDFDNYGNLYEPFKDVNFYDHGSLRDLASNPEDRQCTVIRLPLRSSEGAARGRIKNGADAEVTPARVREWFIKFIDTELPVVMLFLKHITSIELQVVSNTGKTTVLASSHIQQTEIGNVLAQRSLNRARIPEASHYVLEITTHGDEEEKDVSRRSWAITQFVHETKLVEEALSKALGRPVEEVAQQMRKDKLLPHVALALPIPKSNNATPAVQDLKGKLFSLLPLPIATDFPLHIHAIFALLSSRQHLRNSQEDVGIASRERLLIEWNRLIFNTILPRAWSYLLENLPQIHSAMNLYSVWPKSAAPGQGDASYWADLPTHLLDEAALQYIWPEYGGNRLFTLGDVLVANNEPEDLITALRHSGLSIICPPHHIFDLIKASAYGGQILSPVLVCSVLEAHIDALPNLDRSQIDLIADYVASAGQISLFQRIPLVYNVAGALVSVNPRSKDTIIASREEANLFRSMNPNLLELDAMPPVARNLMISSVRRLDSATVLTYIQAIRPSLRNMWLNRPTDALVGWLCLFWEFVSVWSEGQRILLAMKDYDMIPTREGPVRRGSARLMDTPDADNPGLLEAFEHLTVPMLHVRMQSAATTFLREQGILVATSDIRFLLDQVQFKPSDEASFGPHHRASLLTHLRRQLSGSRVPLSMGQRTALRGLPVFPILQPGARDTSCLDEPTLGGAGSTCYFVDHSVSVLPILRGATFIDGSCCLELIRALTGSDTTKNEVDVLKLVLEHPEQWLEQPQDVSDQLVDRIFRRLSDLPTQSRTNLRNLPFVDVGGEFLPPCEVVDPRSSIAALYVADDHVLPVGKFGEDGGFDSILDKLRNCSFLQTTLSSHIIEERIQNMDQSRLLTLLQIVDDHFVTCNKTKSSFLPPIFHSSSWIPAAGGLHLIGACRDRDQDTLLLYDLVVPVVDYKIRSRELRAQLGWGRIPMEIVLEQMRKAVELDRTVDQQTRIAKVIIELANRLQSRVCSMNDLTSLQTFLKTRPWIPISDSELVNAEYCFIESVDLGLESRLRRLPPIFRENSTVIAFLKLFGVLQRPSVDTLTSELSHIKDQDHPHGRLSGAMLKVSIALLTELSSHKLSNEQQSRVYVPIQPEPNDTDLFRGMPNVCFNDGRDDYSAQLTNISFIHGTISRALSEKLGLQRRSDLEYELEDDDFETFDVGEDLTTRIRNVLKAYSEESSSNEWVANADDAGASAVAFICNDRKTKIRKAPSLSLIKYFESPSLIVYNSATFSEDDINGLKMVGQGGKSAKPDSIGRFGLGVLSFYHFGDIMMLVSGPNVLIVDPSGENLPRKSHSRGAGARKGLKMTIQDCRRRYPDLLLAINQTEGFDYSQDYYQGTIFHIPLRSNSHCLTSKISTTPINTKSLDNLFKGPFLTNAKKSLFFTGITSIHASYRPQSGRDQMIWSVNGVREDLQKGEGLEPRCLKLTVSKSNSDPRVSEWLIASRTSVLPPEHQPLASKYRLPSLIPVSLAVRLSSQLPTRTFHLLFAGLPLPLITHLNMHIHAKWILSDNRRHLHLDSSSEQSPSGDIQYNKWLLSDPIPQLLHQTIALLNTQEKFAGIAPRLWPIHSGSSTPSDYIISESLYRLLPTSNRPLFRTPSGLAISPLKAIIQSSQKQPSVGRLLERLCPDEFVIPPFDLSFITLLPDSPLGLMKGDSPALVRSVLLNYASQSPRDGTMDDVDVDELVRYLINGEQPLVGLPLLCLEDGRIVCFTKPGSPGTPVFEFNAGVASIFGKQHVMVQAGKGRLKRKTVDAIVKQGLADIAVLNVGGLRNLLAGCEWSITSNKTWNSQDTSKARQWIDGFWQCCAPYTTSGFRLEIKAEDIEDLPLVPTVNGPPISLSSCRSGITFWRESVAGYGSNQEIRKILVAIGARVIDIRPPFPLALSNNFKISPGIDIRTVIECLGGLGPVNTMVAKVSPELWGHFAAWIRGYAYELPSLLPTCPIIRRLPLWEARQPRSASVLPTLKCLDELYMLPQFVELSTVAMFMADGTTWFTERSVSVVNLLHQNRILGAQDFLGQLQLPPELKPRNIPFFRALLQTLRRLGARPPPHVHIIPNGDLTLCRPTDVLHAARVPLYAFAFQHKPARLVSEEFREFIGWFETIGLGTDITSEGFLLSVTAIDEAIREERGSMSRHSGLTLAFNMLNQRPWIFNPNTRQNDFQRMRRLRFVQGGTTRRSIPALEELAVSLPSVLTLDQLVREEDHLVAWTQRARFAAELAQDLKSVFPNIGVPTAGEVVAHLLVLANAVQAKPEIGRLLIDDLKATYSWLNQHSNDAKAHLLALKSRKIFWNVEEGSTDMQTWHSARSMWLNLTWDDEAREVYSVKGLLEPFDRLIRAAGVREYPRSKWSGPLPSSASFLEVFLSSMNNLRSDDKLTDVVLRLDDGTELNAHRLALAASSAHFQELFAGDHDWFEGRTSVSQDEPVAISVTGYSNEEVGSVITYIYTATFSPPHPPIGDANDASNALNALVNLLDLSNQWSLEGLKLEVEKSIIELDLIGPSTVNEIIERCEGAEAQVLLAHCRSTRDEARAKGWDGDA